MDPDDDDDYQLNLAISMSKDDDFSEKLDSDLDYAFALSLQSECEDRTVTHPKLLHSQSSSKNTTPLMKIEVDPDYALALSLQSEFNDEFKKSSSELNLTGNTSLKKREDDPDYTFALSLQSEFNDELKRSPAFTDLTVIPSDSGKNGSKTPLSIVDTEWETLDPIPNIHSLFLQFNKDYFWGALVSVEVRWSPRMTLCAGICCYEGRGGLCSVRLSQPLLKFRPRRDLIETLLHEMIHAYLFVTHNNKDHDAHGPEFLKHMNRINQQTGTKISVYHSFHDEVDVHRKHWWKCNGPCQHRRPFYGLVKRAMNRAPAPRDPWWADHQAKCGGTFIKIKEPENYGKKTTKRKQDDETSSGKDSDIEKYFSPNAAKKTNIHTLSGSQGTNENKDHLPKVTGVHTVSSNPKVGKPVISFSGKGHTLGTGIPQNQKFPNAIPVQKDLFNLMKNSSPNLKSENKKKDGVHGPGANKLPSFGSGHAKPNGGGSKTSTNRGPPKGGGNTAIRNRGSTTVVLNRNVKSKETPQKVESEDKQTPHFTGTGHILGGASSDNGNSSKTKSPTMRQESIETFFGSLTPKKEPIKKKAGVIFSSDSEDESSHNVSVEVLADLNSELIPCPACGTLTKRDAINNHLDICLKNS